MAAFIEDNFNSYDDGAISGQGIWTKHGGTGNCDVQSTIALEGKALKFDGQYYLKIGSNQTAVTTGRQTFYVYPTYTNESFTYYVVSDVFPNGDYLYICGLDNVGKFWWYNNTTITTGDDYTQNAWNCIEYEWRADKKVRERINTGNWSDWHDAQNARDVGTGRTLYIENTGSVAYLDYINEDPYPITKIGPFPTHFRT
jgi:hypothetical protein